MAWRGLDADWRAEACTVELGPDGLRAAGVQLGAGPGAGYRAEYSLVTDAGLLTESLAVTVHDAAGTRSLDLRRGAEDRWTAAGEPLDHLEGARDCDLAFSPLTNYMPAARLTGAPADHLMAWVSLPDLAVLRSEQRYEPAGERRVRYVGLDHDFTAELELDEDGFVLVYPELAERVGS
jgi:hypothetical protein